MEEVIETRKKICEECPLYKMDKFYGPVCDSSKYLSPDGTTFSYFKKDGWIKGCGCHMSRKWGNFKAHCVAGKW